MWGKDKLLVTGNISFSTSIFKRFVKQTYTNIGLFGKGLTLSKTSPCFYVSFENTVGKGEMARDSVFYLFGEFFATFIKFEVVVCKLVLFDRV